MKHGYETPQKIDVILDEVLSQKGYYSVCKEYAIMQKWPTFVDPAFAAVTKCEKIENGILYVKVKTAPWRQDAAYMKDKIVIKIQKDLGCPTIKDIVFY
jgi:predicted nucleic acid-binding Zn ribbon protein